MRTLSLKDWIFLIPETSSSTYFLYSPVHKFVTRVSSRAHKTLTKILNGEKEKSEDAKVLYEFLRNSGLLELPRSWYPGAVWKQRRSSNKIVLSLTNKCNLRCIYCSAETGLDFTTMPWSVAKDAVNGLVDRTLAGGGKGFSITFHGGGEVFVEYRLLQRCVVYARDLANKHGLRVSFNAVSNTTLITSERSDWLFENCFKHITVSLDGVGEVNDFQRPYSNQEGSFQKIMSGIENLKRTGLNFSIRSTVTDFGVDQMEEFVRFAAESIFPNGGAIHFEPMSLCGRAESTSLTTDPQRFLNNYLIAKKTGVSLGIDVVCSIDTFKKERKSYCGASYASMFCVTPDGYVSACSRVTKLTDEGADLYLYAQHNPFTHSFDINEVRKAEISNHGSLPRECATCFARWNCQGTCPISRYTGESHYKQTCVLIRELLRKSLGAELDSKS